MRSCLAWGFQASALGRFQSGTPLDVITSSIIAPAGSGLTAAQYAAQVTLSGSTSGDLNSDAGNSDRPYTAPGVSLKRNAYRNFGSKNIDFRFQRDFKIGERISISPSFEAFNLFKFRNFRLAGTNATSYGNPGVNERTGQVLLPSNHNFLQLKDTTTGAYLLNNLTGVPRALQFGIRVKF